MTFYNLLKDNYQIILKTPFTGDVDTQLDSIIIPYYKQLYRVEFDSENHTYSCRVPLESELIINTSVYAKDVLLYPFLRDYSLEELRNHPLNRNIILQNYLEPRANVFIVVQHNTIIYYIQNTIIQNVILNNHSNGNGNSRNDFKKYIFMKLLYYQYRQNKYINYNNFLEFISNNIATYDPHQNHMELNLLKNCKLYNYQHNDIEYISSIESKVDQNTNNIVVNYNPDMVFEIGNIKYVYNYTTFTLPYLITPNVNTFNYKFYGATIHSEPGIGKTLPFLYHIFSNCQDNSNSNIEFNNELCNYLYKQGQYSGKFCTNKHVESSYFCNKHKNTLFIEKRNYTLINEIQNYNSNATLVICPSHLCDQWIKEFYDKINLDKNVLLIVTNNQYKHLSVQDILSADLIVVSYQFFINKNYIGQNNWKFTDFKFNRIIFDEVNEIYDMPCANKIYNTLRNLNSKYKWNITGTPFSHNVNSYLSNMLLITTLSYVQYPYPFNIDNWSINELDVIENIIKTSTFLFHKHTRQSIEKEKQQNIIEHVFKGLMFTEPEQNIYDSYLKMSSDKKYTNTDVLIKLCCHVELFNETKELIVKCKTLEEIQQVILKHNENKMKELQQNIKKNQIKEKDLLESLETETNDEIIDIIKSRLVTVKRNITIDKKKLDSLKRSINYLTNTILNMKKETIQKETCPICLDEINDGTMAITDCGHFYCWDCIEHLMNSTHGMDLKCPSCNTVMPKNHVYKTDSNTLKTNNTHTHTQTQLQSLIDDIKSTKIGNIIHYIKYDLQANDKCILFSQWDYLLEKVGTILQDYMNVVYCKGTVYQRKRAIDQFKNDPNTKLILLSSKNCASGLNLTEANKIIFLEPIYGDDEYRNNVETQAIGRINRITQTQNIQVIRFYIQNTIEEELLQDILN